MIAEPVAYHDKFLVGNGEACSHCGGSGRTKGLSRSFHLPSMQALQGDRTWCAPC